MMKIKEIIWAKLRPLAWAKSSRDADEVWSGRDLPASSVAGDLNAPSDVYGLSILLINSFAILELSMRMMLS